MLLEDEPFKTEAEDFSSEEAEEDLIPQSEFVPEEEDDESAPQIDDEMMSNPLMSDFSSQNPPASTSQTQHKSLFDRNSKHNFFMPNLCFVFIYSPFIVGTT